MNVPHLQLGISDAALMASSDGAYGEVELRPSRKFANPRLSALVAAAHAEMIAGFPSADAFQASSSNPNTLNWRHLAKQVPGKWKMMEDAVGFLGKDRT